MVEAFSVLLNVDIDGKMGIDVSHLVLVSLGDASHQVLDDGLDGSEGSDILSRSVVDFDLDDLLALLVLGEREGDGDVREILGELAYRHRKCQSRFPRSYPLCLRPLRRKKTNVSYLVVLQR